MKKRLLFLLLLIWGQTQAQITVSNDYFPEVGDTLFSAIDGMPSITITPPGTNQMWDYSSLQGLNIAQFILPASAGVNSDQFPNADLLLPFGSEAEGGETYYEVSDNQFNLVGYAGPDPANLGINVIVDFIPPVIERRAPLNFFDVNNHSSALLVAVSADALPSNILDSLLITPDSIRIRVNSDRLDVVDSWGSLIIPGGTYDVLREKRREERETRLEAKVGIGPFASWIDVTDFVPFLDFLGRDTILEYHFYSNESKAAIAEVTVSPDGTDTPISVSYKANDIATNIQYVDTGVADLVAYPNPAIDQIRFDFVNLQAGRYTLKLFNILGVELFSETYSINGKRTIQKNIGHLSKGSYLYSLVDNRGKTLSTKRLVIIRP